MDMYNSYPLEYAVDTISSNALYQSSQVPTPPNSATSTLSSMSNPAYINNPAPAPSHSMNQQQQRRRVSPEYMDMDSNKAHPYRNASTSSRKDFPYMQPKRHSRTRTPSDDEVDELTEEPPAPNASEQEKQEYKRRQNTLAARRSRKRKMLYTQSLEMTVERLTMEKEVWKTRALTLKQLLQGHGIPCPDFTD